MKGRLRAARTPWLPSGFTEGASDVLRWGRDLALMGGRRPRLGGREWSGWPHVRPAALCAAVGGSLTLATVVVGLLNALSAQQVIALAVLATLATAGGMIGLIVPDAWAAWRRGFQEG